MKVAGVSIGALAEADLPSLEARMLLGTAPGGELLVLGAHHVEPTLHPDVGYVEVVAVSLARGEPSSSSLAAVRSPWAS